MGAGASDPGVGPLAALLGVRRVSQQDGRSAFEATVRPDHMNPHGAVHGGVLYTLVDYAMGGALTSRLEPGERCVTLEVKINYLLPVTEGTLRAEAWIVDRTKRIAVLEARVYDREARLVAVATGSFYVQVER